MSETFGVMPENWDSLNVFIAMQTQWRISPTGSRTGLEYSSIRPVCYAKKIRLTPEIFADVQIMEITLINRESKNVNR